MRQRFVLPLSFVSMRSAILPSVILPAAFAMPVVIAGASEAGTAAAQAVTTAATAAAASAAPPANALAPVPGECTRCSEAYDGMPQRLGSSARIAVPTETEARVSLTGRTLAPDGLPRRGVILYAYQTDDRASDPSQVAGARRAWVQTDADGLFTFDTVIPAADPGRVRIHMIVIEPGCTAYRIEDTRFSDNASARENGTIVTQRDLSTGRLYATRDIHLGRGVRDYPGCEARPSAHPSTENP